MSTSPLLMTGYRRDYSPLSVIGLSDHGIALKAVERSSGCEVAIKVLWSVSENVALREVVKEIRVMSGVRHPNLMSLKHVYAVSPTEVHLVTDIMETTLKKLLLGSPRCTPLQTQVILFQVLEGLWCLNSTGVCHSGVSLSSILINANCDVRLTGFQGVAQHGSSLVPCSWVERRLPPEFWHGVDTGSADIDAWEAGIVFAELLTWREVGRNVRPDVVIAAIRRKLSVLSIDELALDLLWSLLRAEGRISLHAALRHRYFDSLDVTPSQDIEGIGRIDVESVERASSDQLKLELQLQYSN